MTNGETVRIMVNSLYPLNFITKFEHRKKLNSNTLFGFLTFPNDIRIKYSLKCFFKVDFTVLVRFLFRDHAFSVTVPLLYGNGIVTGRRNLSVTHRPLKKGRCTKASHSVFLRTIVFFFKPSIRRSRAF
jgi:hypothetical protein